MPSHYIPAFTESRWPAAACGASSRFFTVEHSTEPTCPRCAAWLEASPREAEALKTLWEIETRERLSAR